MPGLAKTRNSCSRSITGQQMVANTIHKTDQKVYDACYLACVTKFKLAPLCSEMFKIDVWAKTENSFVQEVNNRSTIAG